jgi:hypothetical protein
MAKDKETADRKPMSLVEARKKVSEHKLMTRIEGNRGGQSVASPKQKTPGGQKG